MGAATFAILTFGCQMNKHDSEKIAGILNKNRYVKTDDLSSANIILLNTCTVRDKADQKVFSKLGRLRKFKRDNPDLIIGVCGCIPQVKGEEVLDRSPMVDFVFGTHNIHQLTEIIDEVRNGNRRLVRIASSPPDGHDPYEDSLVRESDTQAWVAIMTGCNNFCSYCIVPFTRGRERSRKPEDVLREIRGLAERGYLEVTLLGQNVNSYGNDFPGPANFPELLKEINAVPGLERVRFVTSHPKDMSHELIQSMGELEKVCESLHLPLQSGSDDILSRMNRGYTQSEYLGKVERLKSAVPEISLATDIMVGFPGESDADFKETEKVMREVEFDSSFLFKYSPRAGTASASMTDLVDEGVVSMRFERLRQIQKEMTLRNNKRLEGRRVSILVEGVSKTNPERLMGRTRSNKIVVFQGEEKLKGSLIEVEIVRGGLYSLKGRV